MTREVPVPEGWQETTLGEVARYVNGRAFKPAEWGTAGRPIIRIQNLTGSTDVVNRYAGAVDEKHIVRPGDLLLSWAATLGVFVWQGEEAALNQHIFKVHPKVDARFMFYLLQHTLGALKSQVHGTGMQHITKGKFESTPVVIPTSRDEQQRIVSRVDELMSDVDAGLASVSLVETHRSQMRAAVLEAAFSGHLLDLPRDSVTGLPEGWRWSTLGDPLVGEVRGGLTKNARRNARSLKRPYLRVANVYADELRLGEMKEIGVTPEEAVRYLLQTDDLLVVEGNGSKGHIGRVALWNGAVDDCLHQNHIIRVRLTADMNPRFVLHWLLSPRGRQNIIEEAHTTSGLYTLSTGKVSSLRIPLADRMVQDRLVEEVDLRLSTADKVSDEMAEVAAIGGLLKFSILDAAFHGRM